MILLHSLWQQPCHGLILQPSMTTMMMTVNQHQPIPSLNHPPFDLSEIISFHSSSLLATAAADSEETPVDLSDAFTDQVDLWGDPTIRLLLGGFTIVVIVLFVMKQIVSQMDAAIEGVLGDFERTLKQNHPAKWASIKKQLLALTEEARAQKLFQIMQELEQTEPQFMKQVQQQMAENSESESDSL